MLTLQKSVSFLTEKQAHWISCIVHPAFLPPAAALMLMTSFDNNMLPEEAKGFGMFALITCFGTILPLMTVLVLYWQGRISNLRMYHRTERPIPMIASTVFVSYSAYFVSEYYNGGILGVALLAAASSMMMMTFITYFHKASLHAAGISGFLGVLFAGRYVFDGQIGISIIFTAIAMILTMAARFRLRAHTITELITGAIIGFGGCFGVMYLMSSN